MYEAVTIKDVLRVLKTVENIERPDADPLNSPLVYDYLSPDHQKKVGRAVEIISDYVRNPDGEPNQRSISTLKKHGYSTHFDPDQYSPYRYVGSVEVGEWKIDISDGSLSARAGRESTELRNSSKAR